MQSMTVLIGCDILARLKESQVRKGNALCSYRSRGITMMVDMLLLYSTLANSSAVINLYVSDVLERMVFSGSTK